VHHQRQYKKKLDRGEPIPKITAERVRKLDTLGFMWEESAVHVVIGRNDREARRRLRGADQAKEVQAPAWRLRRVTVLGPKPAASRTRRWVENLSPMSTQAEARLPRPPPKDHGRALEALGCSSNAALLIHCGNEAVWEQWEAAPFVHLIH
jgi:hypothetical protein